MDIVYQLIKISKVDDSIQKIMPIEPPELTKKSLDEEIEFLKKCSGINEDMLGKE